MSKIKKLLPIFLLLCCNVLLAQERTVTGTVRNSANAPVIGATVTQKGTTNATVTTESGSFTLKVPGSDVVLVITSIGFAAQEINLAAGNNTAAVLLADDSRQLGEVVVTALGVTKSKRNLNYATQT